MSERFRVVFLGLSPSVERQAAVLDLARAFGVEREVFERLVARAPVTVKQGIDQPTAAGFQRAILAGGGRCRIDLDLDLETDQKAADNAAAAPWTAMRLAPEPALEPAAARPALEPTVARPAPVPRAESIARAESIPLAESIPSAESIPLAESVPLVGSMPLAESVPLVESIPLAEPVPLAQPVRLAAPVPVAAPQGLLPGQTLCLYCAEPIQATAIKCKHCGEKVVPPISDFEASLLLSQGTWIILVAVAIVALARVLLITVGLDEEVQNLGLLIMKRMVPNALGKLCIGASYLLVPLSIWGAYKIARSKGRHWAWSAAGMFSLVGLVVLRSLEDRRPRPKLPAAAPAPMMPAHSMVGTDPMVLSGPPGVPWYQQRFVKIAAVALVTLMVVGWTIRLGLTRSRRNAYRKAVAELDETLGVDSDVRLAKSLQDVKDLIARTAELVVDPRWSTTDLTEFVSTTQVRVDRFLEQAQAKVDPTGRVQGQLYDPMAEQLCADMGRAGSAVKDEAARAQLSQRPSNPGLCSLPRRATTEPSPPPPPTIDPAFSSDPVRPGVDTASPDRPYMDYVKQTRAVRESHERRERARQAERALER